MSRILIVDDEPAIGWTLREMLSDDGHEVALAADVPAAIAAAGNAPDVILLDVRLGSQDGLASLPEIRAAAGAVPVVVMTAFGDLATAVRTVQAGAFDYLVKPFDLDRVTQVVGRALAERQAAALQPAPITPEPTPAAEFVGASPPMQEVFKQVALVAASDLPVLVTGPTGSGKELVARAIHAHSSRHDRPLVTTNLAALAPGVVESELFGHAAGAFTGATAARAGLFELADSGTIFLDEIGEAPPEVQVKLLRVLEAGEVTRVGEGVSRRVDVRVIAATNRDLAALLQAGSFRADLYHRLKVFPITLPALADRLDDIEPLARHVLARLDRRHAGAGRPQPLAADVLTPEFLAALRARSWPGNVRELEHAIEYAAVVARGGILRPEHLPVAEPPDTTAGGFHSATTGGFHSATTGGFHSATTGGFHSATTGGFHSAAAGGRVQAAIREWSAAVRREAAGPVSDLHARALEIVEAALLREALAHTGGNRTAAAKLLGLDRATLRTKLKALGLDDGTS
jgi:DNA-binding NtrC family response regulator